MIKFHFYPRPLRTPLIALALALLGSGFFAGAQAAPSANSGSTFYVPLNRSELVTTNSDMSEVIIADPEVANIVTHGKRKISVIGLEIGQTTMRIFDANQKIIRTMDVYVTYDLPALRRALKEFLPNERIGVSMVNTRIALTGEVTSAQSAATAIEIANEFVVAKLPTDQAKIRVVADGSANESPVLNLMKIAASQQVMLRIKIAEVQRDAVKNLGVNINSLQAGGMQFFFGSGSGAAPAYSIAEETLTAIGSAAYAAAIDGGASADAAAAASDAAIANVSNSFKNQSVTYTKNSNSFSSIGASKMTSRWGVSAQIDALEQNGLLKILAEPTLTAISGEEAEFLAGGEFPIPVPQEGGLTTIEFKKYGVALKFTPFVISDNLVRIQVAPEVSETSTENNIVTSDGYTVPSIVTRRAATTVELAPGESFMIAGLMRDNAQSTIAQLPGVGSVPILGALFRSVSYQRNETELVIAVTPYLVDPIRSGDLKLPTDDFQPPTFLESIFFGVNASDAGTKEPSLEGPTGFMTD